jgi:hypothetical protein
MWVYLRSLPIDCGYIGEWQTNSGWMLYSAGGTDLRMYSGSVHIDFAGVLTVGRHHLVAVWGGEQPPTPDYYSRLYIDGVLVGSGLLAGTVTVNNDTTRFTIGNYANGGGTNNVDGIVDEVAIYNRMLQPEEVRQHYQAAFARGGTD